MSYKSDIEKLAYVASLLTPEMMQGLYHGVIFFEPEDEEKIAEAREIALKYLNEEDVEQVLDLLPEPVQAPEAVMERALEKFWKHVKQ